jgi:hypothetical protein
VFFRVLDIEVVLHCRLVQHLAKKSSAMAPPVDISCVVGTKMVEGVIYSTGVNPEPVLKRVLKHLLQLDWKV